MAVNGWNGHHNDMSRYALEAHTEKLKTGVSTQ